MDGYGTRQGLFRAKWRSITAEPDRWPSRVILNALLGVAPHALGLIRRPIGSSQNRIHNIAGLPFRRAEVHDTSTIWIPRRLQGCAEA